MKKRHVHILIGVGAAVLVSAAGYAGYRKYRRNKAIDFILENHYTFGTDSRAELNTWPLDTLETFVLKIKVDQPIIGPNTV